MEFNSGRADEPSRFEPFKIDCIIDVSILRHIMVQCMQKFEINAFAPITKLF